MHITRVNIDNLPPLGDVEFDCDERVNLFIGPNASGKSTVLRAINSCLQTPSEDLFYYGDDHQIVAMRPPGILPDILLWPSGDWPRKNSSEYEWDAALPVLYIPATRVSLRGRNIFDQTIEGPANLKSDSPLTALFDTDFGIFNGQYVELAIARLREDTDLNRSQRNQIGRAIDIGYSFAKCICGEVIRGDAPQTYVELDQDREISPTGRVAHLGMGILASDDILDEPLYVGALSSGTQGTLLWIYALTLKMASHNDWEEGWENESAILLIDEIENHLHPTWQRRVIPALLDHFPQLQIFATTHSPFVVAGLKAGQVHLLHRDPETGAVTATTNTEDIIGWTADEILRNMMGVDEPTDQLTVDRANRLRQLREKETLTPEEEAELNGLRRQVSEDLLAKGGPLEVQRERYADLMRDFLLSRQSELTQDGG